MNDIYEALSAGEEVEFMIRYWSFRDQYLYDFYEVVYQPDDVELLNAM
jgi:hypothetical protein